MDNHDFDIDFLHSQVKKGHVSVVTVQAFSGSIKNIHLYLNFVFFGFKIAVFFRFYL